MYNVENYLFKRPNLNASRVPERCRRECDRQVEVLRVGI